MKIAQIAPLVERVPPRKYGGTERVVHALTEELVARGHDVTLFASGDSQTSARLLSVVPRSLREMRLRDIYGFNTWTLCNIGLAYGMQDEFDIIHDHTSQIGMPTANIARTPVLVTMHGAFTRENKGLFETLKRPYVVTISKSQAVFAPQANHAGTVYNGLSMSHYPYGAEHEEYLLYVGRIAMEKGVHLAMRVARSLDKPLIIAAKLDTEDEPYFREYIEPYLTDKIRWIGEVNDEERNRLMSKAAAFLHPVTWREPFGLTLIEAMACGCPVVAMNNGSIPEIVVQGKTGFIVSDVEEMTDAVDSIDTIDRGFCRDYALENFSAVRMADGYERIYREILERANGIKTARKSSRSLKSPVEHL